MKELLLPPTPGNPSPDGVFFYGQRGKYKIGLGL